MILSDILAFFYQKRHFLQKSNIWKTNKLVVI